MDFTKKELEEAALILIVDSEGKYKWSSHKEPWQVKRVLRGVALAIEIKEEDGKEGLR